MGCSRFRCAGKCRTEEADDGLAGGCAKCCGGEKTKRPAALPLAKGACCVGGSIQQQPCAA